MIAKIHIETTAQLTICVNVFHLPSVINKYIKLFSFDGGIRK